MDPDLKKHLDDCVQLRLSVMDELSALRESVAQVRTRLDTHGRLLWALVGGCGALLLAFLARSFGLSLGG